jgi:sarcosine oxidase subunit beta
MTRTHDVIVIGAGVIGSVGGLPPGRASAPATCWCWTAASRRGHQLAVQGILRTHYSVIENVELARRRGRCSTDFAGYLGDDEASAGLVRCGYLIARPKAPRLEPLRQALAGQRGKRHRRCSNSTQAQASAAAHRALRRRGADRLRARGRFCRRLPGGHRLCARRAPPAGVKIMRPAWRCSGNCCIDAGHVTGVRTAQGDVPRPLVISTQNIWAERHRALDRHSVAGGCRAPHRAGAAGRAAAYTFADAGVQGPRLARHAVLPQLRRHQMLVSEGTAGETLPEPDNEQGDVLDGLHRGRDRRAGGRALPVL